MNIYFFPDETPVDGHYAATIGFFDGLHQGHRYLMEQLKAVAGKRGLKTMVITFERHPRQVVQDKWRPELLTTLEEKKALIATLGIDTLVVLRFDRQMAALSAREFMTEMHGQLHVRCLLTGYDNRFGHDRSEGFEAYCRHGQSIGMEVAEAKALWMDGHNVSSSHVRQLLRDGRVEAARLCLMRPYTIGGEVVHGQQIGRALGFPTANVHHTEGKLIPRDGVYAVLAGIEGEGVRQGVMNIGTRPTFNGQHRTLEVNIIGEKGNFYGKHMSIAFIARLRNEQPFPSPEALARQINHDKAQAERILNAYINENEKR